MNAARWIHGSVVCLLLACGAGTVTGADPAQRTDASSAHQLGALCTGGTDGVDIAFFGARIGGGPVERGEELHDRNGRYLVLTAACHVYCASAGGVVHDAQVTEQTAQELVLSFELSRTDEQTGPCPSSTAATTDAFGVSGQRWSSSCSTSAASTQLARLLNSCAVGRAPWTGDMRYVAIEEEPNESLDVTYRQALRWPLASDVRGIAVPRGGDYDPRTAWQLARGEEALTLRGLRQRLDAGEFGHDGIRFTPIEEPDGRRYQLWMGDAIPLEDESGLLPFARP